MNEIVKLYKDNPVRIIEKDGEPWFVAKDVCSILELDSSSGARGLATDEKGLHTVQTLGGEQKLQVISEAGLYRLIFKSRKKEAEAFKRWVCHDILPSIRKTGAYLAPNLPLEKLQKIIEAIGEQYKMLIESNSILRQQLEYAAQFIPKTKYGSTSPANGQRRTTIRRGANVAGNGRLISFRNPDEVGYQIDLFEEYLPQVIFTEAVNIISHRDIKQLGCQL